MPVFTFCCAECLHEFDDLCTAAVEAASCPACGGEAPRVPCAASCRVAESLKDPGDYTPGMRWMIMAEKARREREHPDCADLGYRGPSWGRPERRKA